MAQINAEEVYRDEHVRFTLIDDATVRMEYDPDGQFTNQRSFVAVVRDYENVKHSVKKSPKQVTITTDLMKIVYKKDGQPFSDKNLCITYNVPYSGDNSVSRGTWHPGMQQKQNLKGTYRTLDGYSGDKNIWSHEPIPLEDGLLARDGWTLIDDSKGLLFTDEADGWDWVARRTTADEAQDLYFMAYGYNYRQALNSFTKFAGKMPLPPRYAFGYWWSRYWSYSDQDFRDLIDNFKRLNIPLDVLVIDMDWHPISPEASGGWTGWDWNESLFPDYKQFLAYLDAQGVKTTMNLHPADGVRPYEKKYAEFLQRYGRDANAMADIRQKEAPDGAVEWLGSDKQMVKAIFDTYLHPYMDEGVDFWWLDWQQWLNDKKMPELSNTWWCNYLFFNDMERNGTKRPMLYHRWGGLGNHRYQIGFSGDALMTWESLDYLPYFNSTASNVLYGYWSHDIGGHWNQKQGQGVDSEMYTRAMQMATYLPIMRSHSTKDASLNKEPWAFDNVMQQRIATTIHDRYALVPYIYNYAHESHENGVSLCRPLYYDFPKAEEAYSEEFRNEYFFGNDLLVSPITKPIDANGFACVKTWLPDGQWIELSTGERIDATGSRTIERNFTMDEYPVFAAAGSIVPYYDDVMPKEGVGALAANDLPLTLRIFPSDQRTAVNIYEDNGEDTHYDSQYGRTLVTSLPDNATLTVNINREGEYDGMPVKRLMKIALPFELAPVGVELATFNSGTGDFDRTPLPFRFDAKNLETIIEVGEVGINEEKCIKITFPTGEDTELARQLLNGFKGTSRRIQTAVADYKQRNAGLVYTRDFGMLEGIALRMQYHPEKMVETLKEYGELMKRLDAILEEQMHNADDEARFKKMVLG